MQSSDNEENSTNYQPSKMLNPRLPPNKSNSSSLYKKFENTNYESPDSSKPRQIKKFSKKYKEDNPLEHKLSKNKGKKSTKNSDSGKDGTTIIASLFGGGKKKKSNRVAPKDDYGHLPDIHNGKIFDSMKREKGGKSGNKKKLKIEDRMSKDSKSSSEEEKSHYSSRMEDSATYSEYQRFMAWKEDRKSKKSGSKKRYIKKKSPHKGKRKRISELENSNNLAESIPFGNFDEKEVRKTTESVIENPELASSHIAGLFKNLHASDLALRQIADKFNAFAKPDKIFISRTDYLTKVLVATDMDEDSIKAINYTKKIIKNIKKKFTNLAFEGGGIKAFAYSGVVYFLDKYNLKKNIKNVIGTSAGGIAAMLFALDLDATILIEELMKLDFKKFADASTMYFKSTVDLLKKFGLYGGKKIIKFVEDILEKYGFHKDLTFRQLFDRTGINLVITGTEITTMKGVYFHKDNKEFPDMEIKHAIRITTSLPIAYRFHEYTPKTGKKSKPRKFVDGVLFSNLPIDFWDHRNKHGIITTKNEKTLGVLVSSRAEMEDRVEYKNTNLLKYVANIVSSLTGKISESKFKDEKIDGKWQRIIEIDTGDISVLKFDLSNDDLAFMFKMGYEATANFFGLRITADLKFVDDFRDLNVDKLQLNEEERKKLVRIQTIQKRKLTCHDKYLYWLHFAINKVANIV